MQNEMKGPRNPSPDPSDTELMRWADDGGAVFPTESGSEQQIDPKKQSAAKLELRLEFVVLLILVAGAHLSPFAGHLGINAMKHHACDAIATVFCYLSISLLTARVIFQERRRIQTAVESGGQISVLSILGVGAVTATLWMVPTMAGIHTAEVIASALVVLVAQLVSLAVDQRLRATWVMHDVIPMVALLFAIAWVYTNPHFAANHGDEFLAATTVGASSIHSWQALVATVGKIMRPMV